MMKMIAIVMAVFAILGCGNADTSGTGGTSSTTDTGGTSTGGTGGSVTTSSSSGGTGGATTSSTGVEIGPGDCFGDTPISAIDGAKDEALAGFPLVDEGGATLFEDGALACRRVVPPFYPFTVDEWTLAWGVGFICSVPPNAVSFIVPEGAAFPLSLAAEALLTITPIPADQNPMTVPGGFVLTEGNVFYACAQLSITPEDRSCISGCKRSDGTPSPDAFYSNTTNGLVVLLPYVDVELVSESPTKEIASKLGNTPYDWNIFVYGH